MKEIITNRFLAPGYYRQLCRPLGHSAQPELLYTRHFPEQQCTISLRPLHTQADVAITQQWLIQDHPFTAGEPLLKELVQLQSYILQSDFAQSFMILLNDDPACQAEVYHAPHDDLSLYYPVQSTDYVLQLVISPQLKKQRTAATCLLQTCMQYFFSFNEVQQLIVKILPGDNRLLSLVERSGFRLLKEVNTETEQLDLYAVKKKTFQDNEVA